MVNMKVFLTIFCLCSIAAASPALNASEVGASCTISKYADVDAAVSSCTTITVGSFAVPAGKTLKFDLKSGSTLTFTGVIAFAYEEWDGPLMWIKGNAITVDGTSDHLLSGRGELWWDGKGDHSSKKKPQFMVIQATGGSVFKNIKVKNCPHTCIGISDSHDLVLQNWNIDSKDGDTKGGANTDGFDLAKSYRVTIKDSVIWNQDDCVCVNQGTDLYFDNLQCTGGHGLSIAAGIYSDFDDNVVHNVSFVNSVIADSRNAIHIKTIAGTQTGKITSITYSNIKVSGISYYAINVQQDYTNDGSTGNPMGNIPVKELTISNIYGTMTGSNSVEVYILCGTNGCGGWNWNQINVSGAAKSNSCNFAPSGFNC